MIEEKKNKFIPRVWFMTTDTKLIEEIVGYVNKDSEFRTISLNIKEDISLTISLKEFVFTKDFDGEITQIDFAIKTMTSEGSEMLKTYNRMTSEKSTTKFADIYNILTSKGFIPYEKTFTAKDKLKNIF